MNYFRVFVFCVLLCLVQIVSGADPNNCKVAVDTAAEAITTASQKIASSTDDCNPGEQQDLDECADDVSIIMTDLINATAAIAEAVVYCGNGTNVDCVTEISKSIVDLEYAVIDITYAIADCGHDAVKCSKDISAAVRDVGAAAKDIYAAVEEC